MPGPFCKIHPRQSTGAVTVAHASSDLIEEIRKNELPLKTRYISVEVDGYEICSYILESEVEDLEMLLGGKFDSNNRIILPLDEEWRQDNFSKRIGLECWMCLKEYCDSMAR